MQGDISAVGSAAVCNATTSALVFLSEVNLPSQILAAEYSDSKSVFDKGMGKKCVVTKEWYGLNF